MKWPLRDIRFLEIYRSWFKDPSPKVIDLLTCLVTFYIGIGTNDYVTSFFKRTIFFLQDFFVLNCFRDRLINNNISFVSVPMTQVMAIVGDPIYLPCDISTQDDDDAVLLVLWYREDLGTPIYRYLIINFIFYLHKPTNMIALHWVN